MRLCAKVSFFLLISCIPVIAFCGEGAKICTEKVELAKLVVFFLIGIHFTQDWKGTTKHRVTGKEEEKEGKRMQKLVIKNPTIKDLLTLDLKPFRS